MEIPEDERCMVCQFEFDAGQVIYQLRDDDGIIWFAHADCMNEQFKVVRSVAS